MIESAPLITYVMNIIFYIILCLLIILWMFSILCRRYRAAPQNRQAIGSTPLAPPIIHQELPPGLETSIIDTLPKFSYSVKTGNDDRPGVKSDMTMTGECAVCLGAFEEKEILRLLPECGHVFHADCVDTWLRIHATCPFCRAILFPENGHAGNGSNLVEVVINDNDGRGR